jgi:hypothetical protein
MTLLSLVEYLDTSFATVRSFASEELNAGQTVPVREVLTPPPPILVVPTLPTIHPSNPADAARPAHPLTPVDSVMITNTD